MEAARARFRSGAPARPPGSTAPRTRAGGRRGPLRRQLKQRRPPRRRALDADVDPFPDAVRRVADDRVGGVNGRRSRRRSSTPHHQGGHPSAATSDTTSRGGSRPRSRKVPPDRRVARERRLAPFLFSSAPDVGHVLRLPQARVELQGAAVSVRRAPQQRPRVGVGADARAPGHVDSRGEEVAARATERVEHEVAGPHARERRRHEGERRVHRRRASVRSVRDAVLAQYMVRRSRGRRRARPRPPRRSGARPRPSSASLSRTGPGSASRTPPSSSKRVGSWAFTRPVRLPACCTRMRHDAPFASGPSLGMRA